MSYTFVYVLAWMHIFMQRQTECRWNDTSWNDHMELYGLFSRVICSSWTLWVKRRQRYWWIYLCNQGAFESAVVIRPSIPTSFCGKVSGVGRVGQQVELGLWVHKTGRGCPVCLRWNTDSQYLLTSETPKDALSMQMMVDVTVMWRCGCYEVV